MAVFRGHSLYYYQLPAAAVHTYDQKISVIGNVDAYIIDKDYFHLTELIMSLPLRRFLNQVLFFFHTKGHGLFDEH